MNHLREAVFGRRKVFPITITASRPKPNEVVEVYVDTDDKNSGYFGSFFSTNPVILTHVEHSKSIIIKSNNLAGPSRKWSD